MKIEMLATSREAAGAALVSAAVLIGVALGGAPSDAWAGGPGDTEIAAGPLQWFAVTGDAMAPAIPRGSLTLAESSAPDAVQVGDIVTVRMLGGLLTRRVVSSDTIDAGRLLTLQADASPVADDLGVMFTDRATVVRRYVPYAGYASEIAAAYGRSALGLAGLGLLGAVILTRWRMRRPTIALAEIATAPVA